jgi:hypothetical protein
LAEAILPVHIIGMELNLNRFPDHAIHVSGFGGEDGGFMELNDMSQVCAVPSTASQKVSRGAAQFGTPQPAPQHQHGAAQFGTPQPAPQHQHPLHHTQIAASQHH